MLRKLLEAIQDGLGARLVQPECVIDGGLHPEKSGRDCPERSDRLNVFRTACMSDRPRPFLNGKQ